MSKPISTASLVVLSVITLAGGTAAWAMSHRTQPPAPSTPAATPEKGKWEAANEVDVKLTDTPAAVQTAVAKLTAVANVKKVIKETDEEITTYEVEFVENGVESSAIFTLAGDLMELERATGADKLPSALTAAIKHEYPNATMGQPHLVTKTYYEVEMVIDGKRQEVKCDAAGNIEDWTDGKKAEKDKD